MLKSDLFRAEALHYQQQRFTGTLLMRQGFPSWMLMLMFIVLLFIIGIFFFTATYRRIDTLNGFIRPGGALEAILCAPPQMLPALRPGSVVQLNVVAPGHHASRRPLAGVIRAVAPDLLEHAECNKVGCMSGREDAARYAVHVAFDHAGVDLSNNSASGDAVVVYATILLERRHVSELIMDRFKELQMENRP